MKVSELPSALATSRLFSSGVRYRWCGSLPVGMRLISVKRTGSITLTSASSELSTKIGRGPVDAQDAADGRTAASAAIGPNAARRDRVYGMEGGSAAEPAQAETNPRV
jgi:hypothetical protein